MYSKFDSKLVKSFKSNLPTLAYLISFAILIILTARECKVFNLFIILITIFSALMLAAKFLTNNWYIKRLLSVVAFVVYIAIVKTNSMEYIFKFITNKWSFIVIVYVLLLDDWIIPLIVGLYPALRLALLIPEVIEGNSKYALAQVIGNVNGQLAYTVSTVIIYRMFSKLIVERNRYRNLSINDSLTGMVNFSHTIEMAKKMLQKGNISILLTDMDRFKQVNETYGHIAGNKVLIEVAKLLKKEVEGFESIIGRLGGDEFIIVLRNDGSQEILNLGKRLQEIMADKVFVIDPEIDPISLSFSVGQANSTSMEDDVEKLLNKADINMYYNKYKNHRLNIFINKDTPKLCKEGYELLNVLAEKDMYTYVHSGYTAQYAAALARELGYSEDKVNSLYTAGWLHDIGKVLISNDIVRKCGSLTDEEYIFIKNHVNYGISILNDLELSKETLNCVQYHHEFWDGSGYPQGLEGENIPPEARILQIADSYSAMIIKRVYRKTFTPEEALEEITKNKGKQFDPEYVNVFEGFIKSSMGMELA
ncbi:bifunctional diguanylate cyclase/phosphohydrolase [Acetivibrio cellulolyticus]|uniref:bifunctional diguanylate cyclase/phosphohydrolase n=1 Tax=Acetivibrio cellulolyticus TaxID=35830 RepID=UPI0001E2C753|nr:diguanylate cyclase [Acetivibrio cellulolyticus]